jgi:diguanylate cyclase (GGDEF)-like protein
MKQISQRLNLWWFATMAPTLGPLKTIHDWEQLRKRRLFSIILLAYFVTYALFALQGFFTGASIQQQALNLGVVAFLSFDFWVNRRGYLKTASFAFCFLTFLSMATTTYVLSSQIPVLSFCLWAMFLKLLMVAGLFLPLWGPLLLGGIEMAFMWWFTLGREHSQLLTYFPKPGDYLEFLFFTWIVIILVSILAAVYAQTTKKAVIKADRADELEQAHQFLASAYNDLEESHTELEVAHAKIQQQALTDPLTGLPNHRAIVEQLGKEVDRARRFERTVCVLFFDMDHFKALNDGYGHNAGDEALCTFGQVLREQLRTIDTVGRWGGEEFLAILPETTVEEAKTVAERVREAVSYHIFPVGGGLHMTCSIGLSCYPSQAPTQEALIHAADQAMYVAKKLGRNQVRSIDEEIVKLTLAGDTGEGDRETTALRGFVGALSSLAKQRSSTLGEHSKEVGPLALELALKLGCSKHEAEMIHLAGQLHNIGKIGVSDAILQKPGRLTELEWQQIQLYPVIGAEAVACIPALRPLSVLIRTHRERWDGTGYPDRLQKETIPIGARVIGMIDAYMAMVVDRPYQKARSSEDAIAELRRCAGSQFDPALVEILIELLQEQEHSQEPYMLSTTS